MVAVGVAEAVAVAVCGMRLKILLSFYCKLLKYVSECGILLIDRRCKDENRIYGNGKRNESMRI